jgi:hypothetical protein
VRTWRDRGGYALHLGGDDWWWVQDSDVWGLDREEVGRADYGGRDVCSRPATLAAAVREWRAYGLDYLEDLFPPSCRVLVAGREHHFAPGEALALSRFLREQKARGATLSRD